MPINESLIVLDFLKARIAEDESIALAATRAETGEPPRRWVADADSYGIGPRDSCGRDTCAWEIASAHGEDADDHPLPALTNQRHMARWDPDRALAEARAKRRLIERYERAARMPASVATRVRGQDDGYREACWDAILDAAAVYADHPDYDPERWAP
ncbi:DUF6221 family protein [Streptomonospora litoralis]|uniref:Uncharacterized protein n=1 Tax=Streptomonospora litoralis TaxID=2498135 RepID=A0A4P6Q2I7_9ACTN|nr:DUF6221 family protein [Streptomonospora litoralis]QBI53451.1 hypothetical protein EKD16_08285 [Streptomonospora litoralis]